MIRKVLLWPDPLLKTVSADVQNLNEISKELIADLFETMEAVGGVGLSGIQIGVPLRVFVMEVNPGKRMVFVNPKIDSLKGSYQLTNEGCLSLPKEVEMVARYQSVEVEGFDENGKLFRTTFTGTEAQCIQHEVNHLDGIVAVADAKEKRLKKEAKK